MPRLAVFVPVADELRERIWSGSGIVGSLVQDTGRLRLDFEGDDTTYPSYEERVERAAERHQWEGPAGEGYPTSAMAYADPEAVVQVGWWEPDTNHLEVSRPDELAGWLGEES